jgi:Coatomer epsilon subunit
MRKSTLWVHGRWLMKYSVAVIVQIELERNRLDLAKKTAAAARKFAQDTLLVNIAESWIGMREVSSFRSEDCLS